jgi:hypothetical protein
VSECVRKIWQVAHRDKIASERIVAASVIAPTESAAEKKVASQIGGARREVIANCPPSRLFAAALLDAICSVKSLMAAEARTGKIRRLTLEVPPCADNR